MNYLTGAHFLYAISVAASPSFSGSNPLLGLNLHRGTNLFSWVFQRTPPQVGLCSGRRDSLSFAGCPSGSCLWGRLRMSHASHLRSLASSGQVVEGAALESLLNNFALVEVIISVSSSFAIRKGTLMFVILNLNMI